MNYWLVKSDPDTYSFPDLLRDGETSWDGVRNFAARNFLRQMKKGEPVLVYHSKGESAVIGLAEVSREAFPDPGAKEGDWSAIELKAGKSLKQPVTLAAIKATPALREIPLVKISRLSVMPLTREAFDLIVKMGS